MDLSFAIYLFLLSVSVPTTLLRTFPSFSDECDHQGAECVYPHDCSSEPLPSSNPLRQECPGGKVCCKRELEDHSRTPNSQVPDHANPHHRLRHNNSRTNHKTPLFLKPLTSVQPANLEYSVNQENQADVDTRIVSVNFINNSLDTPNILYTKSTPSNTTLDISINSYSKTTMDVESDDNIVFPEKSEEEMDDRIKYIKKLYHKYVIDFKRHNSKKSNEDLPKRKLKYTIGHRSSKFCKLYERYSVDESLLAIPLLPSLYPVLMQKNHCSKPLPLIVGGINATKGEFPHMAGLGYDRGEWIDFLCGGSLISERYVLTAAHCTLTKWGPPIIVRLGTRNLITDMGQNMDVEQVIAHPDYKEPSCYHDIALIKIAPGLQMGPTLRPACLPPPTTTQGDPGTYLTATGWGRTGYGLFSSPNLQKVSLEVMDNRTCEQIFLGGRKSERLPSGIQSSMLCAAGYLDSSHDTCQGDSGGPLQTLTRHSKCMYEVIGITSFGKLCGTGLPAIYTRVSTYVQWIEDIVWPS